MKYLSPIFLLIGSICLLTSCSNGKIEYRKTEEGCFIMPSANSFSGIKYSNGELVPDTAIMAPPGEGGLPLIDSLVYEKQRKNIKAIFEDKDKIEKESETGFLINTSKSDIISYTVKTTILDSLISSSTKVYRLDPGEQIAIGCNLVFNSNYEVVKQNFEIVGERKIK